MIDSEKLRKQKRSLNMIVLFSVLFIVGVLTLSMALKGKVGMQRQAFRPAKKLLSEVRGGGSIGVIYISGVIHSGRSSGGGFMGDRSSGSDSITEMIDRAGRDDSVKALLIRVNSPGGSAAGSQEVYNALIRFRAEYDKPVVISMGDVAASGGYYISAAADEIFADPATLTGSIGVIFSLLNYEELFEKLGLDATVIKSVEHKDIGSPYRQMTPEERAILQSAVDNIHAQFISDVAEGREMNIEDVAKLADGRIFTGEQALEFGLVDQMGGMHEALNFTAKKVGLKTPPDVDYLQRENYFSMFFDSMSGIGAELFRAGSIEKIASRLLANPVLESQ